MKTLNTIFPILDHLYIFQILEYRPFDFLKWFLRNPFRRNLQKKHKLEWTQKTKLLALVSLTLIFLDAVITSYKLNGGPWLFLILLPIKFLYTPLFLIVSQILIWPLEYYQKEKILTATKEKLSKLPDLKIVAITGSFGKTSTKDILYTLLFKKYYVVKTPKSFNTLLGIAQTILEDLKENTDIFIAEIGAYKRGEIKKLTEFLHPTIGVITAVAAQHLERFGSLENIARAKFELVENLPKDGIAILNGENDWLRSLALHTRFVNVVFYGKGRQYYASDIKLTIDGTSFILHTPRATTQITIPVVGEHHVQNFVAAATVALNLGMSLDEIKDRTKWLLPTSHRLEVRKQGSITVIDNTYNTNPESSKISLKLLQEIKGSQKILVTPGLVELGKEHEKENQVFARKAAKVADEIIIVGEFAKAPLLQGFKDFPKEKIHTLSSLAEAMNLLQQIAKPEAVVLLENDLPDQYF